LLLTIAGAAGAIGYGLSQGAAGSKSAATCLTNQCASAAAPSRPIPNVCTLLTNAQAAAAVASPIQNRTAQLPPAMSPTARFRMCTWTGTPLNNLRSVGNGLVIMITRSTKKQFKQAAQATTNAVVIHDLGELAYATAGPVRFLQVYQHGYALTFQVAAMNPLQTERQLAKLVLARLR
jgi:hypothetical protein